jgi:hypothetical protein
MRLLGVLAVLAAIFAVLLRRTIAGWMGANAFLIICHNIPPLSVVSMLLILELHHHAVK